MRIILIALAATFVSAPPDSYRDEILKYRAQREAELKADDGWLTVTGLFWLKPGANVAGSAAGSDVRLPAKAPARLGVFELKDGAVTFAADAAAHVTSAGQHLGTQRTNAPRDDKNALAAGSFRLFVIHREVRFGIRVRDLNSAARRQFQGLRYFPIRPEVPRPRNVHTLQPAARRRRPERARSESRDGESRVRHVHVEWKIAAPRTGVRGR
jgi:uncharacterized protein (DUF1684 family)